MSLPKGPYKPIETEERILKRWLAEDCYKPESAEERGATETFTITMPPPNANGDLHLGHVYGYAYQDLMGRYQRMQGKKVLLSPGKDHAGIQTEVVYENELEKQGTTKQEVGREEFYNQTYDFCINNSANARQQEQRVGVSADFERELFTLEPSIVDDVLKTFTMMYDDELIYRGKRLINWCPRCQSALADIDTEYEDGKSPFFYFKYAFTQPEAKALELKNNYDYKQKVLLHLEAAGDKSQLSEDAELEGSLMFDSFQEENGIEVLPLGFELEELQTQELEGLAVGVEMRLDQKFRLVVISPEQTDNIDSLLSAQFFRGIKHIAGYHLLRFDDYQADEFYTNGFVLGTVRPETKFGDTAVAADPDDQRYAEFIGKSFTVQTVIGETTLNFIADNAVDAEFGTGIVKVTPAHAPEDWDIAQRHPQEALPEKQVIGFDGKLNHLTDKYAGMSVPEARTALATDLKEAGLLVHLDENYENRVQICERCKSRIEPLISHQWFVDTRPLKTKAKQFVEEGITKIMPEGRQSVYMQWMDSEEDWCITRQLWWGYRIPVWYKGGKSETVTDSGEVKEKIGDRVINTPEDYQGVMKVQLESPGEGWEQDPDVLDTWFSSGQWPYLTLKTHGDFEEFYPTQVLETGWDILIFWVTRMMMLSPYRAEKEGLPFEKQAPFSHVYLHGLVLDGEGQKMSKSKGNGIDPSDMINKYGADALRMSYYVGNKVGQNVRLYEDKIASFGRFLNKVWNASKFVMMNLEGVQTEGIYDLTLEQLEYDSNKELLQHIHELKDNVTKLLDSFQFGVAAQVLHNEFWHSFADIHIEKAKPHVYPQKDKQTGEIITEPGPEEKAEAQQVLLLALQEYTKMLHPFIPFITEAIWEHMPKSDTQSDVLMYERW